MQAGARPTAPSPGPDAPRRHRDHRLEPRRPGRRVGGDLRLERLISARPEREVWKARAGDGHSVALKLAPPDGPAAAASARALREEFTVLASLAHPGIVAAGDWLPGDDCTGFTLEYMTGGDLVSLAGLSPAHWLRPVASVLDALRYLHRRGLVHRDIKARNVMLDTEGRARLIDFGSVAAIGSPWQAAGTTAEQRPSGYTGQLQSAGDDAYAFAALVFELLNGRPASRGSGPESAADAAGEPKAIAALHSPAAVAALEPLAALVADMLESSPEHLAGSLEAFSLVIESLVERFSPDPKLT